MGYIISNSSKICVTTSTLGQKHGGPKKPTKNRKYFLGTYRTTSHKDETMGIRSCKFSDLNFSEIMAKKKVHLKNIYYLPKNICLQNSRLNFFHPKSWGFSTAFGYIHCQREQKTALLSRGQKNIYIYFSKNTCTYSNS